VVNLANSIVVLMLVTPATAEKSFSAIRRLKNYLRSTIGQERINSVMPLNVCDKHTDEMNWCDVARDFVAVNEHRRSVVGEF
jgi:hypothetical protein